MRCGTKFACFGLLLKADVEDEAVESRKAETAQVVQAQQPGAEAGGMVSSGARDVALEIRRAMEGPTPPRLL
jgi:hypothetical protein